MQKRSNSTSGLSSDARAWLEGSRKCGFYQFKPDDELIPLWEKFGDESKMFWDRGMSLPITIESLEAFEDEWLCSGESDKYGGESYFIYRHYDDDKKQTLWAERGDHEKYYWREGMRRPEAVERTQ